MCSGSRRKTFQSGLIMEDQCEKQEGPHQKISALLEFSAMDDLKAFRELVEKEGHDVGEVGFWYGRRVGSKKFCYEERTPLMIAAMFGSKGVLSYILEKGLVDVNHACGSDGVTALHCAVAGGSAFSPEVIKLLLDASADVNTVDANGNRPSDLFVLNFNRIFNSRKRVIQALLEGGDGVDEEFKEATGQQNEYSPRTEKKDYPIDVSLPDIKNGMYSTDEFRMYVFKVKPCSRAYSHDWTECPFVHPGENARRRDPRKYPYSCVPCPDFRKGSCSQGDACEYAHGIFECWLHPAQYRTRLCKDEAGCNRRVCFFAHKVEELRPLYPSTGSALPSPNSYSASSGSSLENFTLGSPSGLLPSASSPSLKLSNSRFNSRGIDLDIELLRLENRRFMQQLMMEEMAGLSSPSKWSSSLPNSPSFPMSTTEHNGELNRFVGANPTNLEEIFGSQIQSPTGFKVHQNVNQQLRGYPSPSSVIGSPTTVSLNSRNAAFSKRSHSFIERDSTLGSNSVTVEPSTLSVWGSPDGKVDWTISDDELNKLRKPSSFGFRSSNNSPIPEVADEPDVSWVNSLVKDVSLSPMESGQFSVEDWMEQLYIEQKQMVA